MAPSPASRTYVLDTNVLLYDPKSLFVFDEHDVVIPMTVIEEIDRFKKDLNETGRNARTISRYLDKLRERGSLRDGVELHGGGRLRVDYATHGPELPITWGPETNDNRILRSVLRLATGSDVALVTRDTNMRLKCDALGVSAEDYQNARISVDEQYMGLRDLMVSPDLIDKVYADGHVALDALDCRPRPQEFLHLKADDGTNNRQLSNLYNTLGYAAGTVLDDFGEEGETRIATGPLAELL